MVRRLEKRSEGIWRDLCIWLMLFIVPVTLVLLLWQPVSAETVPVGGCLSGSITGWWYSAAGQTYSANGHGTCGALSNPYGGWNMSQPVVLTG